MLRLPSWVSGAITKSLFFCITTVIQLVFSNTQAQEFFNQLEDSVHSHVWLNLQTIDSGYAHSGNHYSIADSARPFGLGIEKDFPEQFQNKNTFLKVEAWVKSDVVYDKAGLVISLLNYDQQVFWKSVNLSPVIIQSDRWFYISDSIKVPASVTQNGRFKVYLWNNDKKDVVAIDDLKISFNEMRNPSYIPLLEPDRKDGLLQEAKLLFVNPFYRFYFLPSAETIRIYSRQDSVLINDIRFYTERKVGSLDQNEKFRFKLKSVKNRPGVSIIKMRIKLRAFSILAEITCDKFSPEIKFRINERYKKEQLVHRESIVLTNAQTVDEIYCSNRKTDTANFQREYWLGKQGVTFGKGEDAVLIYHTTGISSLQLKTHEKQLWVNLDYEKDHPFLHFPLNNDTTDYKLDWSASHYKKGDKRSFTFSIHAGINSNSLPRLMKNPNGYLATYIWTEHADFTNIRTNRATYFGSEKITDADNAIGGFVKYQIPVTKSVFYSNPDLVTNSIVSSNAFTGLESSIMEDDVYLQFLKQIGGKGSEICLHTPENFTTNKKALEQALGFMQNEFQSPTWIDHGYNNGWQNNREDLVCDGTLKKSDHYSIDLWKKYGLKYFWNPYYEDYFSFENWTFGAFIDQPYSGYGDFIPNPDYWSHPSRSGSLIHWPTKSVLFVPHDYLWDYNFNDQVLNNLIDSWSVEINHCYPAWVDPAKGFWVYDVDSTIVAAQGFNRTLERMANLHDQKKMNVTTVRDFLNYQLAVEKVNYEILPDGRIRITNRSNKPLKGLSFATKARYVLVNDQIPDQKIVGDDIVFWFDLKASQSKLIRLID